MANNFFDFTGGTTGKWEVLKMDTVTGDGLAHVTHIDVLESSITKTNTGLWVLKGFTSNVRYVEKEEKEKLISIQAELGRPIATCAALIPIRKSETWWALAQDERRKIFESKSHHTQTGLNYLPAVARKLYHCRDINEPFDFITWFEYAPGDADFFEELVHQLRQTEEWTYIDREIDIRLKLVSPPF
jgi:chlorite dismutase